MWEPQDHKKCPGSCFRWGIHYPEVFRAHLVKMQPLIERLKSKVLHLIPELLCLYVGLHLQVLILGQFISLWLSVEWCLERSGPSVIPAPCFLFYDFSHFIRRSVSSFTVRPHSASPTGQKLCLIKLTICSNQGVKDGVETGSLPWVPCVVFTPSFLVNEHAVSLMSCRLRPLPSCWSSTSPATQPWPKPFSCCHWPSLTSK